MCTNVELKIIYSCGKLEPDSGGFADLLDCLRANCIPLDNIHFVVRDV